MSRKLYSVLVAFSFEYNGMRYEHQFWSLESLENYFRWEPARGEMIGYNKDEEQKSSEPVAGTALLRLIATKGGVEVRDVKFSRYSELKLFIKEKKVVLGNYEHNQGHPE